jgi:LytS/YehU family sensor histidine kinase
VPLSTEVRFLEHYVELEKIRLPYGADICFEKDTGEDIMIPPMLLVAFVENVFKHGINKLGRANTVSISLKEINGWLIFKTINNSRQYGSERHGFGLKNLRERLSLLYGDRYELTCEDNGKNYIAYLKIPVV